MNKTTKILIAVVTIIAVIAVAVTIILMNLNPKTNLDPIVSGEDLSALANKIYEGLDIELPMLQTQSIDISEVDTVKYMTGLENTNDVEYVVVSEPMMSSVAYSVVLVKVKDGANVEEVAKSMNKNIDNRKWICVTAEKIYTTSSGDVVCLVMSNEETAKTVYEKFKTLAGIIGEEYERTEKEPELPNDMLPADDTALPVEDNSVVAPEDTLPAADPVE